MPEIGIRDHVACAPPAPPVRDQGPSAGAAMYYGADPRIAEIRAILDPVALSDCPVVIQGETGTGKEMLAREIHTASARSAGPFIKLNCAAVPTELMESELFGYERGAFTGAQQRKVGIFELADGGTLLLDEIGDMEPRLQAKLLQVLQDHEFRRLGGGEIVRVDVRVIAATHRDLELLMREGSFREDLFYRLNVFSFHLPSLRERRGDIAGIALFLLRKHSTRVADAALLAPALLAALEAEAWPGNIRQLENAIRKLIVLRDPARMLSELHGRPPACPAGAVAPPTLPAVRRRNDEREAQAIRAALDAACWHRKRAAAALGLDYKALLYRMKKLAIGQ